MSRRLSDNWRTIRAAAVPGEHLIEARPSSAFEQANSERARRDRRQANDGEAAAILANMARDLERVRSLVPGDHRGYLREIEHGLRGLANAVK